MSTTTTKWGLIVPGETDTDDVPYWIQQLANKLDVTIAGFKADTWANRPLGAAAIDGLIFWATDQGNFYLCFGGTLHGINPQVGVVGDITTSAFADVPAAGASGRLADAAHRHGREANPITAHLSAGDPHSQYAFDTDVSSASTTAASDRLKGDIIGGAFAWSDATPTLFVNGSINGAAGANSDIYTVPPGFVALYRTIDVVVTSDSLANLFDLYLNPTQPWGAHILTLPAGAVGDYHMEGFYVAPAGSIIRGVRGNVADSIWVTASGILIPDGKTSYAPWQVSQNVQAMGDVLAYTVPAGRTLILRQMTLSNQGGADVHAAVRIGGAPITPWINGAPPWLKALTQSHIDCYHVLPAGTQLLTNISAAGNVTFYMSGVLV